MYSNLAARDSFFITLPERIVHADVAAHWNELLLKHMTTVHASMFEFLQESVQSFTIPQLEAELLQQTWNTKSPLIEQRFFKPAAYTDPQSIELSFRLTDGSVNYWLCNESFSRYVKDNELTNRIGDCVIMLPTIDANHAVVLCCTECMIASISEQTWSFSETVRNFAQFTVTLKFARMTATFQEFNLYDML